MEDFISSNPNNTTAMPGDNLTLTFSVNEPIQSLEVSDVTIAGLNILSTSPLNSDNTSWQVVGIAVKELMDNLGQGGGGGSNDAAYQFRVKDRSGNISEEVNGNGPILDPTPPGKNQSVLARIIQKLSLKNINLPEMGTTSPWLSALMSLSNSRRSS